jgi:hypothetical protein
MPDVFSQEGNIALTSAQSLYDVHHLPSVVTFLLSILAIDFTFVLETNNFSLFRQPSSLTSCYPLAPESGAALEDDYLSEETEDKPNVIEYSGASGDEAHEDAVLLYSRHRRRVDDDLIETAESIPSGVMTMMLM